MNSKKILSLAASLILTAALSAGCSSTSDLPNSNSEQASASSEAGTGSEAVQSNPYEGLMLYKSQAGLSIYMEEGFEEKTAEGVACYFQKDNCGMTCQRDDFATLEEYEYDTDAMTIEEYTGIIMEIYQAGDEVQTDEYGNTYIYYEQDVMGITMSYYGFYHKGTDAFWGTTFFCPTEDAEAIASDFHLWASSVEVP